MLPVVTQVLLRRKMKLKGSPAPLMSDEKLDRMGRRWVVAILAVCLLVGLGYLYTQFVA